MRSEISLVYKVKFRRPYRTRFWTKDPTNSYSMSTYSLYMAIGLVDSYFLNNKIRVVDPKVFLCGEE